MATSKLTLSIDTEMIDFGKKYVQKNKTSLSKLVQHFLSDIAAKEGGTSPENPKKEYPQWIKDITLSDTPTADFDHKAEYGKHLEKKYGV